MAKAETRKGNGYLDGGVIGLHQGIQYQKKEAEALKSSNDVVTNRVFVLFESLRVLLGYFSHNGVGDYVASSSDKVDVGLAKEFIQRV